MTIWQLMKNLRDKWWIPRWYNEVIHTVYDKKHKMIWLYKEWKTILHLVYKKSLRELVSKESGLRQFVCENGMVKEDNSSIELIIMSEWYWVLTDKDYQYRLIESALKDESELEQFLLDNIKIEW